MERLKHEDESFFMELKQFHAIAKDAIASHRHLRNDNQLLRIPIVWHVLHDGADTNVTREAILKDMEFLNEWFSARNRFFDRRSSFFQSSIAVEEDLKIQFQLATIDLEGNPFDGIDYVFTDIAKRCNASNAYFTSEGGRDIWDTSKYYNIYTCQLQNNILGFSYLPGANTHPRDGTVLDHRTVGELFYSGSTIAHETGHWLGLPHTFSQSCEDDDGIPDTPNTDEPAFEYIDFQRPCPPYSEEAAYTRCGNVVMVQNLMEYNFEECIVYFSKGQAQVMRFFLTFPQSHRSTLPSSPALDEPRCQPNCNGRVCGPDGCGGSCGGCPTGQGCDNSGNCQCIPSCSGRTCGPDGCGGTCGSCGNGQFCNNLGNCECQPNCNGRQCGSDGCGGSCGSCSNGEFCSASGTCVCRPNCSGKTCGSDGCGGTCGSCPNGQVCNAQDVCECLPNCNGRNCGDDGCGGSCGFCSNGDMCNPAGVCVCQPNCLGKECGGDGCGGTCGSCLNTETCNNNGICECLPSCDGKSCGPNGCGGFCGLCDVDQLCSNGTCVDSCVGDCEGRECGDDGCGGSCGGCDAGEVCGINGVCECVPNCMSKECGGDGCGGSCGVCPQGGECNALGMCECVPHCDGRECGPDGCGDFCGSCDDNEFCDPNGFCNCSPNCDLRECGDDGCGGSCGNCAQGEECSDTGICNCVSDCNGRECGDDGCGGSCGRCNGGEFCSPFGTCECEPNCDGRNCGDNGCGGTCGTCFDGQNCNDRGICECISDCSDRECGDDGCGGSCGVCDNGEGCSISGICGCIRNCEGKRCGDDGCGGACGSCSSGFVCSADGRECVAPEASNADCLDATEIAVTTEGITVRGNTGGSSSTVESCGLAMHENALYYTFTAESNQQVIVDAVSSQMDTMVSVFSGSCTNRECEGFNDDYNSEKNCHVEVCVIEGVQYFVIVSNYAERGEFDLTVRAVENNECCIPQCFGKTCGEDGCGGICGTCFEDEICNEAFVCEPQPAVNDDCLTAVTITVPELLSGEVRGGNLLSSYDSITVGSSDESMSSGVWFVLIGNGEGFELNTCDCDFDTVIRIFAGSCNGLSLIAKNDDGCSTGLGSQVRFCTRAGTQYFVTVDGFNGRRGHFVVNAVQDNEICSEKNVDDAIAVSYTPHTKEISMNRVDGVHEREIVDHDMCEEAVDLNGLGFPSEIIVTGNTKDAVAPFTVGCVSSEASGLWYTFIGTGTTIIADTCIQPTYESIIQVISGDCLDAVCEQYSYFELSSPACGKGAEAVFCTEPNVRYWILVEGRHFQEGQFTLRVRDTEVGCPLPSNSPCDNAREVSADSPMEVIHKDYPPSFVTDCKLIRAPDGGILLSNTAWFRFIAPAAAQYGISICSEERFGSFDIDVYEGTLCQEHRCFGRVSDERLCGIGQSDEPQVLKEFCSSGAGQEYHIAIYEGYGRYTLTIQTQRASCGLRCIPSCPGYATCGSDTCGGECGSCTGVCDGFDCLDSTSLPSNLPVPSETESPVTSRTPAPAPSNPSSPSNLPEVSVDPSPSAARSFAPTPTFDPNDHTFSSSISDDDDDFDSSLSVDTSYSTIFTSFTSPGSSSSGAATLFVSCLFCVMVVIII